jgi:MOSC domain-containing protein YiiM
MSIRLVGRVDAVNVGIARPMDHGRRTIRTAFVKEPVDGPVALGVLGLPGDEHVYEDHGGPDMALLAYPVEHYDYWRNLGIGVPDAGAFGENLTVSGLVETEVYIGDVYEIGTAAVQVCQPRSPCYKIAARYGRTDLAMHVQDTGFTGYLMRVIREGVIGAGDAMTLVDRESHGVTVAEAGRVANVDRNDVPAARRILAIDSLGASVRRQLESRVASVNDVGPDLDRLFLAEQ